MARAAPFLRWVGGKRQLTPTLLANVPADCRERRYIEPFLGAGSLFFSLAPERSCLSDANARLINTYCALRGKPDQVLAELAGHIAAHSPNRYYEVRDAYNMCNCASPTQAARFIYLNKACFNGVFRVNTKGKFNVPVGSKVRLEIPTIETFRAVSFALSKAHLTTCDYKVPLKGAGAKDFVYLDPPYPALNETAYFSHYTKDRFSGTDQESLAATVVEAHSRGALILISNADVPQIRSLYKQFDMESVPVKRYVNCKGVRISVSELIIKNY